MNWPQEFVVVNQEGETEQLTFIFLKKLQSFGMHSIRQISS